MSYTDLAIIAVPETARETYLEFSNKTAAIFLRCGAKRVTENWQDDVSEGKVTSLPMAVKREAGEAVVFSTVEWADKASRDKGWGEAMEAMNELGTMPFDGSRIIFGGFTNILDEAA
ncbi:DUF1428 domain-containing protein [Ahrensia sp. R2A130]|uniref:DUF1428 domain-containing protein n=1 Tax=Ahrensia sp. R2A130 TaxID=744979 RepID=UPI0001E0A4CE|nr:DUF1428 domain-containing protein [Ahrensia sp. R2A130]EFL88432.1 response regulator receiver domain-containing protein [Ahrensia sp. R2A130]